MVSDVEQHSSETKWLQLMEKAQSGSSLQPESSSLSQMQPFSLDSKLNSLGERGMKVCVALVVFCRTPLVFTKLNDFVSNVRSDQTATASGDLNNPFGP